MIISFVTPAEFKDAPSECLQRNLNCKAREFRLFPLSFHFQHHRWVVKYTYKQNASTPTTISSVYFFSLICKFCTHNLCVPSSSSTLLCGCTHGLKGFFGFLELGQVSVAPAAAGVSHLF